MKRRAAHHTAQGTASVSEPGDTGSRQIRAANGEDRTGGSYGSPRVFAFALAALFILLILIRVYYFDRFWVPDSDFFDLRETARALLHFELPTSYQRLPLFSAAMALLSQFFPPENAFLRAAEVINFVSFVAAIIFLYRIARRLSGPYVAFATVFLFGLHPDAIWITTEPIAQMTSTALVLLSLDLGMRKRRTAYLAAAFASIARYEGAFLIAALAARDVLFGRHKWHAVAMAGLASTGLLGWLALNYAATGHINPYFSYTSEPAPGLEYLGVALLTIMSFWDSNAATSGALWNIGAVQIDVVRMLMGVLLLVLVALGFWSWFRRSLVAALPIAFFLISCTALNLFFFSTTSGHVFMTLWIYLMAITAGAAYGFELVSRWFAKRVDALGVRRPASRLGLLGVLAVGMVGVAWIYYHGEGMVETLLWGGSFAVCAAFVVSLSRGARLPGMIAASFALCLALFLVGGNSKVVTQRMSGIEYSKASFRLVGEWYTMHAGSGHRMVVSEPWVVQEYVPAGEAANILWLGEFSSVSGKEFEKDLASMDVQYVVWNSHHGRLPPEDYYYRKYRMDLVAPLADGKDWDQFEFLDTVRAGHDLAHIYGLRR